VDIVIPENVVQYLWKSKLKSRDAFLLIGEFITPKVSDYNMPVLKDLMYCLGPTGG